MKSSPEFVTDMLVRLLTVTLRKRQMVSGDLEGCLEQEKNDSLGRNNTVG